MSPWAVSLGALSPAALPPWAWIGSTLGALAIVLVVLAIWGYPRDGSF